MTEPAGGRRAELARALALGEGLLLAAVFVLAPLMRLEDAYAGINSFLPRDLAGEAYFLWLVAFLGVLSAARMLVAGRFVLAEPAPAIALGAYALYVAVRGHWSAAPFEARREALAWFENFALFALALAALPARAGARRALLAALAAGLCLESVRAIWQSAVTLPQFRQDLQAGLLQSEVDTQSPMAVSRLLSHEPFNSFLHPNALGGWMAMAALGTFALAASYLAARPTHAREGRGLLATIALAWLPGLALFAVAFWLTGSKGAAVALAGAVAGTLLAAPPAVDARARQRLRLVGGALLAAMLLAALALRLFPETPGRAAVKASLDVRLGYWRAAATMAGEHPAFGVGPGLFGARYPALKDELAEESQSAHNAYLETAAEEGLVGLALLGAFWGLALWRLWRRAPGAGGEKVSDTLTARVSDTFSPREERLKLLAATGLAGLGAILAFAWLKFDEDDGRMLGYALVWLAGFALAAWPLVLRKDEEHPEAAERLMSWGLAAAALAFLIHSAADMTMSLRSVVGPALLLAAAGLAGPGRCEAALEGRRAWLGAGLVLALAVAALACGVREYGRAQAYAQARELPPPELKPFERCQWQLERLERALQADPENALLLLSAAQTAHAAANWCPDRSAARRLSLRAEARLLEAVRVEPFRVQPLRVLAGFYLLRGDYPEAQRRYEQLIPLYPLKAENLVWYGDAALLSGEAAKARRLYEQALATSRRVGDEAIHLSILFENYNRLSWEGQKLDALAAALDARLKDASADAAWLFRRGLVEVARGKFPESAAFLERAAAAAPHDAGMLLFAGYARRLAGDWDGALALMRQAELLGCRSAPSLTAGPGAIKRAIGRTLQARALKGPPGGQEKRAESAPQPQAPIPAPAPAPAPPAPSPEPMKEPVPK